MQVLYPICHPKKRQRRSSGSSPESALRAVKKHKSTPEANTDLGHRPPEFWDSLSKVRLTRGAVREFDRRNLQVERQQQPPLVSAVDLSTVNYNQHLKRLSRHGGPDLDHLRGFASRPCPQDIMTYSGSQSRKRSSASKSSPYNGDFEQKLIDSHIYPEGYEYSDNGRSIDPKDMDHIQRHLRKPRHSLSSSQFSEDAFRNFKKQTAKAANEASAMADVIPIIAGESRQNHQYIVDARFNNMSLIVDGVTVPKPDVYDGAKPERINPRVRQNLGDYIIPSTNHSQPAVPNFFFEGKSAAGRADVAKRQACYDGAVGARAIHSIQNFGADEPYYDGNAYCYSSTFHNGTGTLQLYSTHITRPDPVERPHYHMTQIKSYAMTSDLKSFRKGATAFRNLRDLGKTHRDKFINEANNMARHTPESSPPTSSTECRGSRSARYEDLSDTSTDELAAEETTAKRSRHAHLSHPGSQVSARNHNVEVGKRHEMRASHVPAQPNARSRHRDGDDSTAAQHARARRATANRYSQQSIDEGGSAGWTETLQKASQDRNAS